MPEFLFKRDVMPDPKPNNSDNVFQISEIQKTGAFVGRCTEMCGTYHSMMNFELRVVEPNDFKAYLEQRIAGKTNAEALAAIEAETFDVAVLDIGMPLVDGYQLLRQIRERPAERQGRLPAAALTAYARTADRTRSLKEGFQMHLTKPIQPSELTAAVQTLAGRRG